MTHSRSKGRAYVQVTAQWVPFLTVILMDDCCFWHAPCTVTAWTTRGDRIAAYQPRVKASRINISQSTARLASRKFASTEEARRGSFAIDLSFSRECGLTLLGKCGGVKKYDHRECYAPSFMARAYHLSTTHALYPRITRVYDVKHKHHSKILPRPSPKIK